MTGCNAVTTTVSSSSTAVSVHLDASLAQLYNSNATTLAALVPTLISVFASVLNVSPNSLTCLGVADGGNDIGSISAESSEVITIRLSLAANGTVSSSTVASLLVTDYDNGRLNNAFLIAGLPQLTSSNGIVVADSTTPTTSSNSNALSTGALIGIIVGSVVACLILSAIILCFCYYRNSRAKAVEINNQSKTNHIAAETEMF